MGANDYTGNEETQGAPVPPPTVAPGGNYDRVTPGMVANGARGNLNGYYNTQSQTARGEAAYQFQQLTMDPQFLANHAEVLRHANNPFLESGQAFLQSGDGQFAAQYSYNNGRFSLLRTFDMNDTRRGGDMEQFGQIKSNAEAAETRNEYARQQREYALERQGMMRGPGEGEMRERQMHEMQEREMMRDREMREHGERGMMRGHEEHGIMRGPGVGVIANQGGARVDVRAPGVGVAVSAGPRGEGVSVALPGFRLNIGNFRR